MRRHSRRTISTAITAVAMVALLAALSTAIAKGKWTKDDKLNQSIANVLNASVDRQDISNLEKGYKGDPDNANMAAVLSGAYGLAAEESGNKKLGEQAEAMAMRAAKLNPDEPAVKVAVAGVQIQSANPAEREQGERVLKALGKQAPKVAHYLLGKKAVLEGDEAEGMKHLKASKSQAAQGFAKRKAAMREEFSKRAK